jgi:hypothetical protein
MTFMTNTAPESIGQAVSGQLLPAKEDGKATRFVRLLLAFSSFLLAASGLLHAAAFSRALPVIARSGLPAFYANSFKTLWLADSATLLALAGVFGFFVARPAAATRSVVLLLALIPAATAVLMYVFVGRFFVVPLLLAPAIAAFVAGLRVTRSHGEVRRVG